MNKKEKFNLFFYLVKEKKDIKIVDLIIELEKKYNFILIISIVSYFSLTLKILKH